MTIQLKHGVILTAFRQEIVARYEKRHAWVGWTVFRWDNKQYSEYMVWRKGFANAMAGKRMPKYRQALKGAKARLRKSLEAHLRRLPATSRRLGRVPQHNDE